MFVYLFFLHAVKVESTAGNGKAITVCGYFFLPPLERITELSGSVYQWLQNKDINIRQSGQNPTFKGPLSVGIC